LRPDAEFGRAGSGEWNDPDMLEIGNGGMSDDEYRTHMTPWAMSAARLLMRHDLRATGPSAPAMPSNRAIIAVDRDALGAQGKTVRVAGEQEVRAKPLASGRVAVALFDRGKAAAHDGGAA
jgi:alpha-galactosidase